MCKSRVISKECVKNYNFKKGTYPSLRKQTIYAPQDLILNIIPIRI